MKSDRPPPSPHPPAKVLTARQMAEVDRLTTERYGIPGLVLMENAGLNLYLALAESFPDLAALPIAILCGRGNNGGDGLVLARHLCQRSIPPDVFLLASPDRVRGDAAVNLEAYRKSGGSLFEVTSLREWEKVPRRLGGYAILVDALLGTGISKPLEGLYARVVAEINSSRAFVLAVDIPSGMFSDSLQGGGATVRASATVTFTAPKIAHLLNPDQPAIGSLKVVPIGTPRELLDSSEYFVNQLTAEAVATWLPPRHCYSHKGDFGHLVLAAGSRGKSGAAILSARGALRAGSGLVTACTPDPIQGLVASSRPEIMTEGLGSDDSGAFSREAAAPLLKILAGKDVLAVGPGVGGSPGTVAFLHSIVRTSPVPVVIDADGLNAFQGELQRLTSAAGQPLILTPHPGEFSRLIGESTREFLPHRLERARGFSRERGVWLVLKGFRTLVADPQGQIHICPLGNPGMATAGMGDVLTGVIASLVGAARARGKSAAEDITRAVSAGVYLHSLAGDLAAAASSQASLTASDVVEALPHAFRELGGGGG